MTGYYTNQNNINDTFIQVKYNNINNYNICSMINYENQSNDNILNTNIINIKATTKKWWIYVPILYPNNQNKITKMLADPGANQPCVSTSWALYNFNNI